MFDVIKNFLISTINAVTSFLPDSPFEGVVNAISDNELLTTLNWFVPVGTFVAIGQAWLVAIALFYIYSAILRWVKAIE